MNELENVEKKKGDNKRYYNFTLIIYEDDERFDNQLFNITQEKDAIWIRHDSDLNEEGEIKKPHYHVVLKLKNACTLKALSKRIEVEEHMIEPVKKSLNGCLKYLVHYGNDDKFQYDISCVESNSELLKRRFEELVTKDLSEEEKVEDIEAFMDTTNDYIDLRVFGKHVRKINRWDAFRRNFSYFKAIIDSHNAKVSAERYHMDEDYYAIIARQNESRNIF